MLRVLVSALLLSSTTIAHAQSAKPTGEKAKDPRDRMICKRFAETGSLVGQKRVCKPKIDWERERDQARQDAIFAGGAGCGDLTRCR